MQTTTKQPQHNPLSGTVYEGGNQRELAHSGYKSPEWATFLQWRDAGYKIIKGSKGTCLRTFVRYSKVAKVNGKNKEDTGHAPRYFTVFNRGQVEKK